MIFSRFFGFLYCTLYYIDTYRLSLVRSVHYELKSIKTTVIIITGSVDSQDHIFEQKKMRFILNHIRSVQEESTITSDYLEDIRSQKDKVKHTLIVFIKEKGETLTSLFRKLESLISTKIMKGDCDMHKIKQPKRTCNNEIFSSYFKCNVKMAETGINSVLVEFTSVNDGNPECQFSKTGEIRLGIGKKKGVETSHSKTNWFIIDHLFGSTLFGGKSCTRR